MHRTSVVFHLLVVCTLLSGCMMSPLDGDQLASISTPLRVTAYTPFSGESPPVECRRPGAASWIHLGRLTQTSAPPFVRFEDEQWWEYAGTFTVPVACWSTSLGGKRRTEIRSGSFGFTEPPGHYAVFNATGLDCLNQNYLDEGLATFDLINQCRLVDGSGSAREAATVYAPGAAAPPPPPDDPLPPICQTKPSLPQCN